MSAAPLTSIRTVAPDIHRTLPHSLEAEKALLCAAMLAPAEVLGVMEGRIVAASFYLPAHQTLWQLLCERWAAGLPCDVVSLTIALRALTQLDAVGGPAFITEISIYIPTAMQADHYAAIVAEKATARDIIGTCTELAARAYNEGESVPLLLDEAEARILTLSHYRGLEAAEREPQPEVLAAIKAIERLYETKGACGGLTTGFSDLDATVRLREAEMIVVAARPSVGKTAIAMQMAEHVAIQLGKAVGVFSLEMSSSQLRQRSLCSLARVNLQTVRDGFASDGDLLNLTAAFNKLGAARLRVDDASALPIGELRARARRWHHRYGMALMVVDYLQLVRSVTRRAQENRQIEVAEISAGLKALAKELNIPIIVCAQLNRDSVRGARRPKLGELRESGAIEQDADVVLLLHRPEMNTENEKERRELLGEAEIIIAKQRNGPTGDVRLTFLKEYTRFEDRV